MTVVIYRKRNIAFGRAVPSNYFILKTVKRIVWRFFVYLRLSTSSTMKVASPVSTAVKLSKSVKVKYIRRHLLSESDETARRIILILTEVYSIFPFLQGTLSKPPYSIGSIAHVPCIEDASRLFGKAPPYIKVVFEC